LKVTIANLTKGKLPIDLPHEAIDPDQWPSVNEIMHWSGRMSHAAWRWRSVWAGAVAASGLLRLLRRMARRTENPAEAVAAALYHALRWAFLAGAWRRRRAAIGWSTNCGAGSKALWSRPDRLGDVCAGAHRRPIDEPPRHRIGR
jgi:hypothetical protein